MSPELETSQEPVPPEIVVLNRVTTDPLVRDLLISSRPLDQARRHELNLGLIETIQGFSDEQCLNLYAASLERLADEHSMTQDGRDALLGIFSHINAAASTGMYGEGVTDRSKIVDPLYNALDKLSPDADAYGSFSALLTAARDVAMDVNVFCTVPQRNDAVTVVRDKTRDYIQNLATVEERDYAESLVSGFAQTAVWGHPGLQYEDEVRVEKARSGPRMQPGERLLHDRYLELTETKVSAKMELYQSVPEFRAQCEARGVLLENFWNKHHPKDIASKLDELRRQSPELHERIMQRIQDVYGVQSDDPTAAVYADETHRIASELHTELLDEQVSVDATLRRLQELTTRTWRSPKARRKFEEQLCEMLEQVGVSCDVDNVDWRAVGSYLDTRNSLKRAQAEQLNAIFAFAEEDTRFDICGRTTQDMYLADVTGDCTSYHLDCGFNGHIVPVWLSMPNFVFAVVYDDHGKLAAKVGLMLGIRDEQPCLVIDSVEASRLIPYNEQEAAGINIDEGLTAIMEWGQSIGLPTTYGFSFNNSSELIAQINARSKAVGKAESFEILGGLNGISEYAGSLLGEESFRMYYQTTAYEGAGDGGIELETGLQQFEDSLARLMSDKRYDYLKPKLDEVDWQGFVEAFLRHECAVTVDYLEAEEDAFRIWGALETKSFVNYDEEERWNSALELVFAQFGKDVEELDMLDDMVGDFFVSEGIGYSKSDLPQTEMFDEIERLSKLKEIELAVRASGMTPQEALERLRAAAQITVIENEETGELIYDQKLLVNLQLPQIVSHKTGH